MDGPDSILASLPPAHRAHLERALADSAGYIGSKTWEAFRGTPLKAHPELSRYLDWLLAKLNPVLFNIQDAADRSWQEQKDAAQSLTRVTDFPHSALSVWGRPAERDAPFLRPGARHISPSLSYARVLLSDDCTRGPKNCRVISYENAWADTSSVHGSRNWCSLERARAGYSVVMGIETSEETRRERSTRIRSRSVKKRPKVTSYVSSATQQSLFDVQDS
ncbi:hypothetical protein [Streptomyces sparsogenes]|uniref:hypothetical protein n=1 Tax=Streptomyces sparsogenes TaxID=67365 RepID=UPI00114D139C|nr:hypothetical protein [Streptomyces sparsogenes]